MVTESGFYKICRVQSNPEVARYDAELDEWHFVGEIEPVKVTPLKVGDRVDVDTYDSLVAPVVRDCKKIVSVDTQSGTLRTVATGVDRVDVHIAEGVYFAYHGDGCVTIYSNPNREHKVVIGKDIDVSFT